MSYCPECEAVVEQEFDDVGEVFPCPDCGVELEVVSIDPVEFDLALVDEENDEEDYHPDDTEESEEAWDEEDDPEDDDKEEEY